MSNTRIYLSFCVFFIKSKFFAYCVCVCVSFCVVLCIYYLRAIILYSSSVLIPPPHPLPLLSKTPTSNPFSLVLSQLAHFQEKKRHLWNAVCENVSCGLDTTALLLTETLCIPLYLSSIRHVKSIRKNSSLTTEVNLVTYLNYTLNSAHPATI